MVAGEDLDGDAPVGEDLQRFGGGGGEGVLQGDEPRKVSPRSSAGTCSRVRAAGVPRSIEAESGEFGEGDRQDAQSVVGVGGGEGEQLVALLRRQGTAFQYGFHGALDDEGVRA